MNTKPIEAWRTLLEDISQSDQAVVKRVLVHIRDEYAEDVRAFRKTAYTRKLKGASGCMVAIVDDLTARIKVIEQNIGDEPCPTLSEKTLMEATKL